MFANSSSSTDLVLAVDTVIHRLKTRLFASAECCDEGLTIG